MLNANRLFRSFKCAGNGLCALVKREQNFRIHLLVFLVVLSFSVYFEIKIWQWSLIILLAMFVLVLEIVNTAFERMIDILKPTWHEHAGAVKDLMSAAVLIVALASVAIGLLIFIPYIFP
ncbi:MAG: diacylglycerol kinase family protein [Parcubacteria group bacterium]